VINAFETGSIQGDYSDITIFPDGPNGIRQITYGRAQTTEYSHLRELVDMYVNAGGKFSNDLRPFVDRIGRVALVDDSQFKDLLHRAGAQDQVMRDTQDAFFDRRYFQPALNWAQKNGFSRALSVLVIYELVYS
jgi:chitosanase